MTQSMEAKSTVGTMVRGKMTKVIISVLSVLQPADAELRLVCVGDVSKR
jgi:hypothetical protein